MSWCSLFINFCAYSSFCCYIIVASLPSFTIFCSFFSRFCTSSSSSPCSAKARWASLEISALYSGGIDTAITVYNYLGDLIYHLFGTDLLRSIFDRQFQKVVLLVLQQCGKDCVVIGGRSAPLDILGCAIDLLDGAQCKCKRKCWFFFYNFLWTLRESDYFRLSCELVRWLTIVISQALEIVCRRHAGAIEGMVSEGKSFSWGGALIKDELHKQELTKNMFLHSNLLKSLSSFLKNCVLLWENSSC